ncbi:MAG: transposase [Candidatus Kerfeldbacteria bacterium]|nr:transposase [Candidatus Kerfeldbacteria bacterium]
MYTLLTHRTLVKDGYYHVFNRGNGKQEIFHDDEDYQYFLSILAECLQPQVQKRNGYMRKNYHELIQITSFTLMPNHMHMSIKQCDELSLSDFLQSVSIRYSKYRNKKYDLVGHTFQDRFKARLIEGDEDLINVSAYIHCNPRDLNLDIFNYPYSSLQFYVNPHLTPPWMHIEDVSQIFKSFYGLGKKDWSVEYKKYIDERPHEISEI